METLQRQLADLSVLVQRVQLAVTELVEWKERSQPVLEGQVQSQAAAIQALQRDIEQQQNQVAEQLVRMKGSMQAEVARLEGRLVEIINITRLRRKPRSRFR